MPDLPDYARFCLDPGFLPSPWIPTWEPGFRVPEPGNPARVPDPGSRGPPPYRPLFKCGCAFLTGEGPEGHFARFYPLFHFFFFFRKIFLTRFPFSTPPAQAKKEANNGLLYTPPSPRDATLSRMPSSA